MMMRQDFHVIECKEFEDTVLETLNKHAPLKKRYIIANNDPFMNKPFCKAIMVRFRLRNKFLKLKTTKSMLAYKKRKNHCVTLLREAKKSYYEKLHVRSITGNKKFWRHVKSLFSDKIIHSTKITLIEDKDIVSECVRMCRNI